jgi:CheY-like chemotaxis protein
VLAKTLASLESSASSETARTGTSTTSRRLLIVHESKTVRAVLRAKLASVYGIVEASSADEALRQFREESPPDVVLCQRTLNGASGLDVCRRIRGDASSDATFVVLASEDTPELRKDAESHGAQAVVTQSLPTQTLVEVLQRADKAR